MTLSVRNVLDSHAELHHPIWSKRWLRTQVLFKGLIMIYSILLPSCWLSLEVVFSMRYKISCCTVTHTDFIHNICLCSCVVCGLEHVCLSQPIPTIHTYKDIYTVLFLLINSKCEEKQMSAYEWLLFKKMSVKTEWIPCKQSDLNIIHLASSA